MPRRGYQGLARSCVRLPRAGSVLPPLPPPPWPGRAGPGSSEPSGGLGTCPESSVPPRCVAGCGFIILIDSSCSPTPWGPRPKKGGGGGICGPLPGSSPPSGSSGCGPFDALLQLARQGGREVQAGLCPSCGQGGRQGGAELCGARSSGPRRQPWAGNVACFHLSRLRSAKVWRLPQEDMEGLGWGGSTVMD